MIGGHIRKTAVVSETVFISITHAGKFKSDFGGAGTTEKTKCSACDRRRGSCPFFSPSPPARCSSVAGRRAHSAAAHQLFQTNAAGACGQSSGVCREFCSTHPAPCLPSVDWRDRPPSRSGHRAAEVRPPPNRQLRSEVVSPKDDGRAAPNPSRRWLLSSPPPSRHSGWACILATFERGPSAPVRFHPAASEFLPLCGWPAEVDL